MNDADAHKHLLGRIERFAGEPAPSLKAALSRLSCKDAATLVRVIDAAYDDGAVSARLADRHTGGKRMPT